MNNFSIQSLYNWYRNTIRNPKYRWWMILGTLLYIFSPFDIAPDFLPIIGQIDDVVVLTLLVSEVSQLLIDKAKARQGVTSSATVENPTTETTVDVDSVSVH
ncbi:MAG TPA: YkvA family protein [Coleofasciculaceae cyanobacterium]